MDKRMVHAAQRYAAADRTDPFTFNRAMTHIANGVAGFRHEPNGTRVEAFYNAKEVKVKRKLASGEEYEVVGYDNMVRP